MDAGPGHCIGDRHAEVVGRQMGLVPYEPLSLALRVLLCGQRAPHLKPGDRLKRVFSKVVEPLSFRPGLLFKIRLLLRRSFLLAPLLLGRNRCSRGFLFLDERLLPRLYDGAVDAQVAGHPVVHRLFVGLHHPLMEGCRVDDALDSPGQPAGSRLAGNRADAQDILEVAVLSQQEQRLLHGRLAEVQLQQHDAEDGKQVVADPSLDAASAQAGELAGGEQPLHRGIEAEKLEFTFRRFPEEA
ncbi:hypothetical protein SDC9_174427 [bioreactor metagenome]|uniref:Uncharacterized protein n=1 Tax=bioreactor metagenome TaxID=1076179 RepID=A0A645GLG2_9ZZZZ